MKSIIYFCSFLVRFQKLDCCKRVVHVTKLISGKWKAVNGNSSKVFIYSFTKSKGDLEISYEPKEGEDEKILISNHDLLVEI
ncbi:hypothetical protein [Lacinutrix sp. Bg11-31]|uniref:hypothetical protein n=1 Tax=Lacinutrix sp. Bg11-31 TaxID=2057808 RepID=UPI000C302DCC|nr:hypothetical protein [Lacinutrix sp. Bg11-31]AUC80803.1 hypothetical protein CW733_01090 [Lacinutrix sp. Bg11-31]